MMPSLHFQNKRGNMDSKCMFCRGRNILCTGSNWAYKPKKEAKSNNELTFKLLSSFPESLLLHIFQFLDLPSLLNSRRVCRKWKRIAEDRQLWKTTNFSCKRIIEKSWIFSLPKSVRDHASVMNLMWSSISVSAFRGILRAFPKTEVLLLQNCRFSKDGSVTKRSSCRQKFPSHLKVLDVRNVQDRWFDEYSFPAKFLCIEAVAFSQTLPNNWLSILSLSWMPNLRIIHIQNNPCVSEEFLKGIIENSPSLQSINVQGCMNINGEFLRIAVDELPHLRHIDVNSTRLEGRYLSRINWSKCKLESLSISFCCKVTTNDLKAVLPRFVYLKHLQASFVGWGKSFCNDVVNHLVNIESKLSIEYLDLQSTFHMSASSLIHLCSRCPNLKNLRIGTILKTNEDVVNFLQSVPRISELSLQAGDCSYTAIQMLQHVTNESKNLKSLYLYNVQFDLTDRGQVQEALENLFGALVKLENFFIGGYPHKERAEVEELISTIASSMNININTKRPRRVIPMHSGSFDDYLHRVISIPTYKAYGLRTALQQTHDCQLFYQSGIQRMNSAVLLRQVM
ncbi:F-box/LRR-repeat protein 20-like [Clytia hemisphaerica]|uniref:F-box/LRR-repeat protein 20-like n=1 Tax=Clytia hemisphaerica TaxID=252671 RepID=UPI0034D51D6C